MMHMSDITDENSIPEVNNRRPLETIKQNVVKPSPLFDTIKPNSSRRQSSVGFDADNCSKRLKVLLQEKEKQLTFLGIVLTMISMTIMYDHPLCIFVSDTSSF
jgi:hypothetical protein